MFWITTTFTAITTTTIALLPLYLYDTGGIRGSISTGFPVKVTHLLHTTTTTTSSSCSMRSTAAIMICRIGLFAVFFSEISTIATIIPYTAAGYLLLLCLLLLLGELTSVKQYYIYTLSTLYTTKGIYIYI